jgi:hypothetical protein
LAEPTVASRSFPDAARTVQITAGEARKIFDTALKLSGCAGQTAANRAFTKALSQKIIFARSVLSCPKRINNDSIWG